MARMTPMVERGLRRSFDAVPRTTKVVYDWKSEEGERFLQHVDTAVRAGVHPGEIGRLLGITNFAARYHLMRRGLRAMIR